ncbi:hypothetical protein BJV82DRAFT_514638 [Fennellomyces sp. T-0311]|nr:hypothetical protein BJV82DRAFT_514638 [Fennellomyces sp. T-0311]
MSNNQENAIPEMMHALQVVKQGPAEEAFEYNEIKTPIVKQPTDVLIKVKATGVNSGDAKLRSGKVMSIKVPRILGFDFSGNVVAKGSKVDEFEIGDAVYGIVDCMQKGVVASIKTGAIAKKPENISFEEAASVGLTAYQGIVVHGNYPDQGDKKMIVVGASGGVGINAVQIAKAIGAQVVAICSGKNASFVSSVGADRVFDYTSKESMAQLAAEKSSHDLVLDCVGGDDYYNQLIPLLKPKGCYVTAVGPIMHVGSDTVSMSNWAHIISTVVWRRLFGPCTYIFIRDLLWKQIGQDIHAWLSDGTLKAVVSHTFDLKDGAKAHALVETQRVVGKIVLKV